MTTTMDGIDWKLKLQNATLTTAPASDAEALAKSAVDKAITPGNLAAIGSSATFAGLVELATSAEVLAGTDTARAVTPAGMTSALAARKTVSFAGHNLAGACTLTGAKVNDVVVSVTGIAAGTVGDQAAKFESVITVADQIQQSEAADLSANIYMAVLLHKS